MSIGRTSIEAFKCERCGHVWLPRDATNKLGKLNKFEPKVCPKCKNAYWNIPRKQNKEPPQ